MTDTPAPVSAAPDLVKLLLFRSSDEAGIGWTPSTVVHVPAGLLHNAADTITALTAEVERLNSELLQRDMTWLPAKDAENERLRAALKDIATVRGLAADLQARARAALKEPRT